MNQAENSHEGLKNRKRFKCSKCNQYTLHIGRDRYECENKCILKEEQIESILKVNDHNDYYLTKDLEELFEYDFYYKSNINKEETETSLFSFSENEKMNKIAHQTVQINNLLDDSAIAYFRKVPNKEVNRQG